MRFFKIIFVFFFVLFIFTTSCGRIRNKQEVTEYFAVGGTITGLSGTVVVQLNNDDDLELTENGSFVFSSEVEDGKSYEVSVKTQPSAQTCTLANQTGIIEGTEVTNVAITCAAETYSIGGVVTGLTAGTTVVLQNNNGETLSISEIGSFVFTEKVADGSTYAVSVKTQPSGLFCSAGSNSGTVSGANVTTISVVCSTTSYSIGGTLSGLGASKNIVLQNNAGDNLTLTASGLFVFSTNVAEGATYSVSILTQPSAQLCSITTGSGTATSNVTTVSVTCIDVFSIGGVVAGLGAGKSVTLQNNGANNLTVSASGAFTFTTYVSGAYAVTILTQPTGQTCGLSNATGTASANVTNVQVTCVDNGYNVTGSLTGLAGGQSVVIQNLGAADQTLTNDGAFTIATGAPNGTTYSVSVSSHPSGQYCGVYFFSGTVAGSNISNISVVCSNDRKFFRTAATKAANLGNVALYDAQCSVDANVPPGGAVYKAFMVDGVTRRACSTAGCSTGSSENINWVLRPFTRYLRSSDSATAFVTNPNGLPILPFTNSFSTAAGSHWTGLSANWTTGSSCTNWSSNMATGNIGSGIDTNVLAISNGTTSCAGTAYIICVEQ